MKSHKLQIVMFCLVALATLFVSSNANADTWNKATKLTFTEPVEVAGTVLQSGTYWFQLMNSPADRHIVQIWNADRSRLISTILTVPNYRLQPTGSIRETTSARSLSTPRLARPNWRRMRMSLRCLSVTSRPRLLHWKTRW